MLNINLTIIVKTCGDRTATVAVLESNGYKKALIKCLPGANFKDAFSEAVGKLNQASVVNVRTNKRGAEVNNLVMRENAKGRHKVFLQPAYDDKHLNETCYLEWLAYEIALQNGTDEVITGDILKV